MVIELVFNISIAILNLEIDISEFMTFDQSFKFPFTCFVSFLIFIKSFGDT